MLAGILGEALVIDPERVFLLGTSHGGQTAMSVADAGLANAPDNPMGTGPRFAGILNFYGGCGLFSAFGGSGAGSTWRPGVPFLMVQGEMDTTIWSGASSPMDTRAKWEAEDCGQRIAAAKADPSFDQFLEAIVYAGARHDFESVTRDDIDVAGEADPDFPDWRTKVHSHHFVAMPFMTALEHLVAASRLATPPPLALSDLGFSPDAAMFTSIPFLPGIPPQVRFDARGRSQPVVEVVPGTFDLLPFFFDPLEMNDVTFGLIPPTGGFSLGVQGRGQLIVPTSAPQDGAWVQVGTPSGVVIHFVEVSGGTAQGTSGSVIVYSGLEVSQGRVPVPTGSVSFQIDMHSVISGSTRFVDGFAVTFDRPVDPSWPGTVTLSNSTISGNTASVQAPLVLPLFVHSGVETLAFTLELNTDANGVDFFAFGNFQGGVNVGAGSTQTLPALDFQLQPPDSTPTPSAEDGGGGGALDFLVLALLLAAAAFGRWRERG